MVKLRNARYCNLKLFLIYLVVYGHWIENRIWDSEILQFQYRLIYLIHMPLFVFLTGFFIRSQEDCLRQIRHLLPIYLFTQLIALLCGASRNLWTPFWHLWYLLSCCLWMTAAYFFLKLPAKGRWIILSLALLIGCGAGHISWLDRTLSGSRTVVFFPYFWLGVICRQDIAWEKYRGLGILTLIVSLLGIAVWGNEIPVTFLYQAAPFGSIPNGSGLRLLCYILGGLLGFSLLTWTWDRRYPWTRAGADTMNIYLIHAPVVAALRQVTTAWEWCPLYAAALIYLIYKLLQWYSHLYGITAGERRVCHWLHSKKSINNTADPSTDFCSP